MAPTSIWTHPFKSHLETTSRSSIGCTFRALVHSESGLDYCLRKLPPQFVAEFRAHNSRGRAAEEQGAWKTAEDSFLQCRRMIMVLREGLDDPLGSVVHNSLLAWANLFLAQLYQSVGTPGTLETAMELRDEILDCVLPLHSSGADPELVKVCEIYYCTARYELGDALGSSEEMNGAIESYSEVMSCSQDSAAAQICFLLCLDHMCMGRFKEGLRWIREANRVRKKQSADWSRCKFFFLEYEAAVLMKLERFSEAVEALEDLTQSPEYRQDRKVHTLFLECYSEMARRAADEQDVQRAEEYKDLAKEQQSLIQSLLQKDTLRLCQVLFPSVAFAHPLMMPTTSPLGISRLGCTQAHEWRDSDLHLKKFPNAVTWILIFQIEKEQEARKQNNWETTMFESEQTRGLLQLAKGVVDKETHGWLLAWVDLPLASLYHFRERTLAKALAIWKEIQKCTEAHKDASSRTSLKDYHVPFAALEYELNTSTTWKYDVIQTWARTHGTDEKRAERDLCFWLYFGYHLHENFEEALKWLLESKRLREDHDGCLRKRGAGIDYFCCDYAFNRCEVELFTKLGMDEKAKNAMESLCISKHVQHDDLMDVNFEQDDESVERQLQADSTPSTSGCIAVKQSNRSDVIEKLEQSSAGLEHHLQKLPFPIQLALRKHSYLGRLYDVEHADWENAIFQYEWCQELLNAAIQLNNKLRGVCNWLMTWIALPLASLYQYKTKNNYKKALDLRMLMVEWVTRSDRKTLVGDYKFEVYVAAYLCAVSDYPCDPGVRNQVVASAAIMLQVKDEWFLESLLIRQVTRDLMVVYENYEGGLLFIRRAMQLVEQRFPEPAFKLTDDYVDFLLWEVIGLRHLRRPDEVKTVLENYWRSSGKSKPELPKVVQQLLGAPLEDYNHGSENFEDFIWQYDEAIGLPSGEALELSKKMRECCLQSEYAKAIRYLEEFLKLIEDNPKSEGQEHDQDMRSTFVSNARIAILYTIMFARSAKLSTAQPPKAEFGEDGNFLHALEYYKKCLHQLTTKEEIFSMFRSNLVASVLLRLIILCFLAWNQFDILSQLKSMIWKKLFSDRDKHSEQIDDAYCDRLERILKFMEQLPVQKYAQRLIMQHTRSLHTVGSKHYSEGWIEWLEDYKFVYSMLQRHHRLRGFLITAWIKIKSGVNPKSAVNPEALKIFTESEVDVSWWTAFLYAERERTQVMLYQHEIHRRNSLGFSVQHWSFDAHDNRALGHIKESCRALLMRESSVFVQYSPVMNSVGDINFYSIYVLVIDQDYGCKLFVEETPPLYYDDAKPTIEERRLKDFYAYLAYKTKHPNHTEICHLDKKYRSLRKSSTITNNESMNKYLEFLYDVLIGPIAHHLDKMKPADKLVVAPCELLTQVPFAALRNREDQKYLIESHAMAIAPSLRVLQMCSERAQALQSRSGHGRGCILALGDPTYDCDDCIENNRLPLKATAKEVDYIASVFREAEVVTLTGKNATTRKLIEWAAKLSQERLAIVHVGAHAVIDKDRNHLNNHLQLACDPSLSSAGSAATSASGHQASEVIMSSRRGKPADKQSDDDASDSEVDEDATVRRSTLSRIMESSFTTNRDARSGDGASSRDGEVGLKRNGSACALAHDLTVEGIQSLEQLLSAELLVLSACQTSAGRTTTEGVLSLARAFMAMGVPCVVASLWKVDDEATFALMKDFYDGLQAGNDVACAMQSATLHSMARHGCSAVQCWAPFNVWGVPSLCIPQELQHHVSPPRESSSSHG